MKTNRQRELSFLRYLNALDRGDSDAIANFLEEAEQDELLEDMMLDYHQQDQQKDNPVIETPTKTIVPFKLKREQTRHILQIVGTSAVAALILVTVGVIGLILGMRQNNTTVADTQHCTVSLANEDNTVHLIGGDDIESPLQVGVNNPFTLYLNTGQASTDYQVIFEGLRAIMAYDDLIVAGDCSQERALTVYPHGEIGNTCEVQMEPVGFPFNGPNFVSLRNVNTLILLGKAFKEGRQDVYPVESYNFTGHIPANAVHITGDCTNYPIFYVPPRVNNSPINLDWEGDFTYKLEIDNVRVREQRFENGIMLYIKPIDSVWVAYVDQTGKRVWTALDASLRDWAYQSTGYISSPEGLYPPENGLFRFIWQNMGSPASSPLEYQSEWRNIGKDIGWAISEPVTYMADYEYPTGRANIMDWYHHFITISTGEVYEFYPSSLSQPTPDLPAWDIVGEDK